jgi:hypothetical protein
MDRAAVALNRGRPKNRNVIHSLINSSLIHEGVHIGDAARRNDPHSAAGCDTNADRPSNNSLTGRSTSRGIAALITATSRYSGTSTAGSIRHERSACHRASRRLSSHQDLQTVAYRQYCTINIIYVGTVAVIPQHRTVPQNMILMEKFHNTVIYLTVDNISPLCVFSKHIICELAYKIFVYINSLNTTNILFCSYSKENPRIT